jgi:hypothetical protein
MIKKGNFVSRRKGYVSEINGVRREVVRRAHHINSQTQGEISSPLSSLERQTMWGEEELLNTLKHSSRRASS